MSEPSKLADCGCGEDGLRVIRGDQKRANLRAAMHETHTVMPGSVLQMAVVQSSRFGILALGEMYISVQVSTLVHRLQNPVGTWFTYRVGIIYQVAFRRRDDRGIRSGESNVRCKGT